MDFQMSFRPPWALFRRRVTGSSDIRICRLMFSTPADFKRRVAGVAEIRCA